MIKSIWFDWGSVLAKSDTLFATETLSAKYNCNKEEFLHVLKTERKKNAKGGDCSNLFNAMKMKFGVPKKELVNFLKQIHLDKTFYLARRLSKHYDVILLSNQVKFKADYLRKKADLSFFSKVFFSNEVGMKKPYKNFYYYALKKTKLNAKECIFIDDKKRNIDTAKELGFKVIHHKDYEATLEKLKIILKKKAL
ncbi:HAD-IA family hydrolase [Nanoarchaeota archaeon]